MPGARIQNNFFSVWKWRRHFHFDEFDTRFDLIIIINFVNNFRSENMHNRVIFWVMKSGNALSSNKLKIFTTLLHWLRSNSINSSSRSFIYLHKYSDKQLDQKKASNGNIYLKGLKTFLFITWRNLLIF